MCKHYRISEVCRNEKSVYVIYRRYGWLCRSADNRSQDCPVSDSFDQSRVNPSADRNRFAVLTPSCKL